MKQSWKSVSSLLLTTAPFLLSAVLTLVLYGASVSYGFMFDDPLDLPRASGRSYISILTSAGDSSYYRPLMLIVWKTLYELLGGNQGVILHLLTLIAHVLNGWLVYVIGRRLQGRFGGYFAMLLFVSYPLSYQAVAYVNASFHTLVTTFLLSSVISYQKWRENDFWPWLTAAIAMAILAVFTHEYGVTVAVLIGAAEINWLVERSKHKPSPALALFVGISIGFSLIWLLVPRWQRNWEFDPMSLWLNSLFFFQGLVYPIASQLSAFDAVLGFSAVQPLLLFGGLLLTLVFVIHFLSHRTRPLGFALAWTVTGVLPALVTLPFSYLVDGPRLLYLASVGISLSWSGMLSASFAWRNPGLRIPFSLLSLLVISLILVQSTGFIRERGVLLAEGAKMIRGLVMTANDPQRPGRTYVNFPSWFALKSRDYPIGHTGTVLVPEYIGLGRVNYATSGHQPEIVSVAYDVVASDWDYHYAAHGRKVELDELETAFRRGGGVYATRFYSGSMEIEYVGAVDHEEQASQPLRYLADFGGWGRLIEAETLLDRGTVEVRLKWRALGKVDRDYTMFVHVYDAHNKVVAQVDGYPIGHMFPPRRWRPGDLIDDHRRIALPFGTKAGSYRVVVGIYDRQNGQRAQALDVEGTRYRDDGVTIGTFDLAD